MSYCQYIPEAADQPPYDPSKTYRNYNCVFPMDQVYGALVIQWICYGVAAIYLNNVLANEVGSKRKGARSQQPPWAVKLACSCGLHPLAGLVSPNATHKGRGNWLVTCRLALDKIVFFVPGVCNSMADIADGCGTRN